MCLSERARIHAACVHAFVCRHFCGRVCIEDSVNSHGCVSVVLVFCFRSPQQSDLIKIKKRGGKKKKKKSFITFQHLHSGRQKLDVRFCQVRSRSTREREGEQEEEDKRAN